MRSLGNFITIIILILCFLATAGFLYLISQDVEFSRKGTGETETGMLTNPDIIRKIENLI